MATKIVDNTRPYSKGTPDNRFSLWEVTITRADGQVKVYEITAQKHEAIARAENDFYTFEARGQNFTSTSLDKLSR